MIYVFILVVMACLAAGIFLFLRQRAPQEESVYHFKCPGCKKKLRYRGPKAGHRGMCPRCKLMLTFPQVSANSD